MSMGGSNLMAALMAGVALSAFSASPVSSVRWLEKDYDFGLMKEVAGPKTGQSRFVNAGLDTLSITDVRPSCGCTSAVFTETPLAPGDTAVIRYTYDPAMRPGKFAKHVRVNLSDGTHASIAIKGNVLGTPESLSTLYPVEAGMLRLSDAVLSLGDVTWGRAPMTFVNAYSLSPDTIAPTARTGVKGLTLKQSDRKAGPGDIVTFSINFDSRAVGRYGDVEMPVTVSDGAGGEATVSVRAFVTPDTEYLLMKQNGRNPGADLATDVIELGEGITGGTLRREITLRNSGDGPLEILGVSCPSEAFTFRTPAKPAKQGRGMTLKMEVDVSRLPSGPFRIPVKIVTNDPARPVLTVSAAGIRGNDK